MRLTPFDRAMLEAHERESREPSMFTNEKRAQRRLLAKGLLAISRLGTYRITADGKAALKAIRAGDRRP